MQLNFLKFCKGQGAYRGTVAAGGLASWQSSAEIKASCWRFNEGAVAVAPHCNSSSLNGTANPCRDEAVRTIGLPSMWRNIPATRSNTHQSAVGNHCERKKKESGRRMEEPTLAGDSSCLNVVVIHCRDQNFIQFTAEEMACSRTGKKRCGHYFPQ